MKDTYYIIKNITGISMMICLIIMGISFIFNLNILGIILGIVSILFGILYWYFDKKYENICKELYDSCKNITVGKPDNNGFADTYIDGKKTNTKLLLFSEKDISKLQGISDDIYKRYDRKRKIEQILKNK